MIKMESMIVKLLEKVSEIIIDNVEKMKIEERYFMFSSFFFLVFIFFQKKYNLVIRIYELFFEENNKEYFFCQITEGVFLGINYLMAIFLSSVIVTSIIKFFPDLIKFGAYEEKNKHCYLKEQCVPVRDLLSKFHIELPVIFLLILLLLAIVEALFQEKDLDYFVDLFDFLECILVWLALEKQYYSGKTYNEECEQFQKEKCSKKSRLKTMFMLTNETMHESVRLVRRMLFPIKYGINYPDITYVNKYSDLFVALQKEENVFVENVFYHDWGRAFFLPLHKMLLKDRKVVIFTGPSLYEKDLLNWVKSNLKELLCVEDTWSVGIWEPVDSQYDISIVPYTGIFEFISININEKKGYAGIFCVMFEPSRILAEMQHYFEIYANLLRKMDSMPVFCFADKNVIGLTDYISHIFRCKIYRFEVSIDHSQEVFLCISTNDNNAEVKKYWGVSDKYGCGVVYFAELLKHRMGRIVCVSEKIMPIIDICSSIKSKMLRMTKSQTEALDLEKAYQQCSYSVGIWGIQRRDEQFIIAYDEACNWYDLYWQLATRGNKFIALFLLSGNYMLFDFMVEKSRELLYIRNGIPVLYPVYQDTDRNRLLKLIRQVAYDESNSIALQEIKNLFEEIKDENSQKILHYLNKISSKYYNQKIFYLEFDRIVVEKSFIEHNRYLWENVYLIDEGREEHLLGGILACHFEQKWLEKQYIVREGCHYQLREYRERNGRKEAVLLRSRDYMHNPGYYYQMRLLNGTNAKISKEELFKGAFVLQRCTMQIRIDTIGWYIKSYEESEEKIVCTHYLQVPSRNYYNKDSLLLRFSQEFASEMEENSYFFKYLAELLGEMCRTLYPQHYQYLMFQPLCQSKKTCIDIRTNGLMIVEDCEDDLGLIESVEKNIDKLLNLCYEYSKWKIEKRGQGNGTTGSNKEKAG